MAIDSECVDQKRNREIIFIRIHRDGLRQREAKGLDHDRRALSEHRYEIGAIAMRQNSC